jgi:hypothetical protein
MRVENLLTIREGAVVTREAKIRQVTQKAMPQFDIAKH